MSLRDTTNYNMTWCFFIISIIRGIKVSEMLKYENLGISESKKYSIFRGLHQLILIEASIPLEASLIFFHRTVPQVFEECSWSTFSVLLSLAYKHDLTSMSHLQFPSTEYIIVYVNLHLFIHVSTKHFFRHYEIKWWPDKCSTFNNSMDIQSNRRKRTCKQWGLDKDSILQKAIETQEEGRRERRLFKYGT